jgi:hypothetical protein
MGSGCSEDSLMQVGAGGTHTCFPVGPVPVGTVDGP